MRISNRFEKHIVAAASVAMGAAAAANAAVVYSGVINFVCAVNAEGCYINVETNVLINGEGSSVPGWDVNPFVPQIGSIGMGFYKSPTAGKGEMRRAGVTTGTAGNLALGTSIASTGSWNTTVSLDVYGTTSDTGLLGGWTYSSENIIGFKFLGADALTHYGWMRFDMGAANATLGPTRTVVDYGYESTAGASILAGAGIVPAPGALALLGVAGFIGARRRRA